MHNLALLRRPRTIYRGWWIVLTGLLALIVSGGTTSFIFSVLIKPMEADLGWSRATLVGVLTLGGLVSGVLAASVGPLFDKHGARFMMTAGAVLGGVCFILVSRVSSPWQYYLLLGVGEAITRPALDTVGPRTAIANWFVSKRPAAYAIFTSGRAVAGITLVSPMAWLAMNAGWRMVWVVMGLLELVLVAPLAWASVRKRPEDEGLLPDGVLPDTQPPREATLHEGAGLGTEATEVPWSVSQALHTKSYWALVLGIVLVSFPGASIFIHMSPYFQDKGLSTAGAALLLSVYASGALLGRVVWAFLAARIGIQRSLTTFAVAYGTAIMLFIGASGVLLRCLPRPSCLDSLSGALGSSRLKYGPTISGGISWVR